MKGFVVLREALFSFIPVSELWGEICFSERTTSYKNATRYWCSDLQCEYIIHDKYWNSQASFASAIEQHYTQKTESLFVI